MNIGVLLKQVPDTETKIRINGDGTGIEEGDIKWIISPYDEYAVEAALQLKEKMGAGEVLIFSLGATRTLDAARTALAMGADRAVILDDDGFAGSDALGVARSLAAAIAKEDCGIVFGGRQAIDTDSNAVPQIVAGLLEWPHATWINSFEYEGETATVKRPVGGGNVEVVKVRLPAVFTCTKGLNEPRYASLPGIMKAKRKPVTKYTPDDLDVEVGGDNAQMTLSNFSMPPARPAGRILQGELSDQVAELVKLLREEAKVL
ncbi:MAG: electron transfer flavoprotein subunit beta/FixA family protein [Proteobacteria bacterium]|nr:electron transfer flavoprotein subunit beta/FixA family protein [Pseudomonadota bacterium]